MAAFRVYIAATSIIAVLGEMFRLLAARAVFTACDAGSEIDIRTVLDQFGQSR